MKKTLLTILSLGSLVTAFAQVPSPNWTITQNAGMPIVSAGVKFLDAVDQNTVWLTGYDGTNASLNINYWSVTTNGGTTYTSGLIWQSTVTPNVGDTNTYRLSNLEAIDGCNAWVSAYEKAGNNKGAVFKTVNGGGSWVNMNSASMFTNVAAFTDFVTFLTPSVGIAVGDPVAGEYEIWRTTDGGTTWAAIPGASIANPLASEFALVNIYCKQGTNNWWFGTNKNRIYHSSDAGLTWTVAAQMTSTLGAVLGVNDIAFVDANKGLAGVYFGPTGNGTLTLWNTVDGGATWAQIPVLDPNHGKNDFCNIPGTSMYASGGAGTGNYTLSYSSDNGVTWSNWNSSNIQYLYMDFVDPQTGWVGSFSNATVATTGGIYKYNGPLLNNAPFANFTMLQCGASCTGSYTINNETTGNPAASYSWTAPGASLSSPTATNPAITFTASGNYTVTLTATSGTNISTSSKVIPVVVCAGANALFNVSAASCKNAATTVTNNSTGTPAPNYTWSCNPGALISNVNAVSPLFTFTVNGTYTITLVAVGGGSTTTTTHTTVVSQCVGIAENTLLNDNFGVYPNPTSDVINIDVTNIASYNYKITDVLGKVMLSDNVSFKEKTTVDVSRLNSGIYFLTIECNGQRSTKKIIVE